MLDRGEMKGRENRPLQRDVEGAIPYVLPYDKTQYPASYSCYYSFFSFRQMQMRFNTRISIS